MNYFLPGMRDTFLWNCQLELFHQRLKRQISACKRPINNNIFGQSLHRKFNSPKTPYRIDFLPKFRQAFVQNYRKHFFHQNASRHFYTWRPVLDYHMLRVVSRNGNLMARNSPKLHIRMISLDNQTRFFSKQPFGFLPLRSQSKLLSSKSNFQKYPGTKSLHWKISGRIQKFRCLVKKIELGQISVTVCDTHTRKLISQSNIFFQIAHSAARCAKNLHSKQSKNEQY